MVSCHMYEVPHVLRCRTVCHFFFLCLGMQMHEASVNSQKKLCETCKGSAAAGWRRVSVLPESCRSSWVSTHQMLHQEVLCCKDPLEMRSECDSQMFGHFVRMSLSRQWDSVWGLELTMLVLKCEVHTSRITIK